MESETMPQDAKLGLILGVGLVILIAVLFFHRDQGRSIPPASSPSVSSRAGSPAQTATPGTTNPMAGQSTSKKGNPDVAASPVSSVAVVSD
jgi:hypothetical protein